jgi:hypothetical protein
VSLSFHTDNGATTGEFRGAQLRLDVFEVGVAAGAIDNRLKRRRERQGVIRSVEREVWNFCLPPDADPVELAIKTACRPEDAGDPFDGVHVRILEEVFASHVGIRRVFRDPGAECSRCMDLSFWNRVGENCVEGPRCVRPQIP